MLLSWTKTKHWDNNFGNNKQNRDTTDSLWWAVIVSKWATIEYKLLQNKPPSFPYTLDYKIFHDCMIPPCPTKAFPGLWELPLVMWNDLKVGSLCLYSPVSALILQSSFYIPLFFIVSSALLEQLSTSCRLAEFWEWWETSVKINYDNCCVLWPSWAADKQHNNAGWSVQHGGRLQ